MTKIKRGGRSPRPSSPRTRRGTGNTHEARPFRSRACPACGEGTISRRDVRGMSLPHRDAPEVVLTVSIRVPCCDRCREMLLDVADAGALDVALARDYRRQRQATLQDDLRALLETHHLRQCDIERLCGVSAGYVSKVLRDEKAASPLLLRLVHLLRVAPHATVVSIGEVAVLPPSAKRLLRSSSRSA